MTVTLAQIEQEVARRAAVWEEHLVTAHPSTTTVVAATLQTAATAGDPYTGQWLLRRTATDPLDRQRRIVAYDPATGTLTVDRPWSLVPGGQDPLEITPLDPAGQLRRAVVAGLGRCFFVDRAAVPVTAGRVEEDLSAALFWITDVAQIRDLESRIGAASTSRPVPLDWYRPFSSASGVSVGVSAPTGGTYLVEALRPHATYVNGADAPNGPTTDADVLACPLDYAAAAGHAELWRYARAVLAPVASGPQRLAATQAEAAAEFNRLVRSQWWYWNRPDRVVARYPGARASADEWVTQPSSWSAVAARYSWRGLSSMTWRQVLTAS